MSDPSDFEKMPVNIDLLIVKDEHKDRLGEVTSVSIFDNLGNFDTNGLFSTTIFGKVGSEFRTRTFSQIDLKTEIIHPLIYSSIIKLKSFYKQILDGSVLAEWDIKTKSFIKSNKENADTGYNFFFSHVHELVFEKNESEQRSFLIDLFNKAVKEDIYKLRRLLVLPAGMRDYNIDSNGKPQEDEVNTLYRKLLFQSSLVDSNIAKKTPEVYDGTRNSMQKITLDIFEYFKSLLEGKNKLILGKWLTRKIFNSTRNVLSNPIEQVNNINDPNRLGYNECYVGLHQFLRALVPKTTYELKNKYLKEIFIENDTFAYLTNASTFKREEVINTHIQKDYDMWTSSDGLEKIVANFGNLDIRHLPITVNKGKHYLGLIYNDGKFFKFLQDINSVPDNFDKSKVSPITYAEFLYLSVFSLSGKYPALITRYPITGYGSIYPAIMKLKSTSIYKSLIELDENWNQTEVIATSFPVRGSDFFNTTSVAPSHYGSMGADIDGDTISLIGLLSDESKTEIDSHLKKKEYYISPEGKFFFSISTEVLDSVLSYITD